MYVKQLFYFKRMKKIKKAQQEQEFISEAPEKDLIAYMAEYQFRPQNEKIFMRREGIKEAKYYYIELYGLSALGAARMVFEQDDESLVQALLYHCEGKHDFMRCFLDFGRYQRVKAYVDEHEVAELSEQDALRRFDEKELLMLAKTTQLSAFARCDILARGNDVLKEAVLRQGNLQERELEMLWIFGSKKILKLFVEISAKAKQRAITRQILVIRFGSFKDLKAAVNQTRFHMQAEKLFLEIAPLKLVEIYVQRYYPEGCDKLLFECLQGERLLNFLKRNRLTLVGEELLVERWHEDELLAYCDEHYLNDENEVAFISRADHEVVMFYLERHSLCEAAQLMLIERQDDEEINFFEEKYVFSDSAAQKLEEYRNVA